ncbi:hypothetical protein VVD49_18965 [Uliginosibacterium sp. H3]|uniref:Acyl carrier protein n=1 Tax=Uliginosibacterium silvisoli TaxID=3114758 RepID=A0ABU6K8Q6_9RHOO|nr:hypothetical protein [Uliginosibacterium sp. H3]
MLKDQIVSELLINRESGVMKIDDDYELDSLAKLEVIAFLENVKAGFLDNCFDAVADAGSLDAILTVFDSYQVVTEVA